jgi:hypothetical protein
MPLGKRARPNAKSKRPKVAPGRMQPIARAPQHGFAGLGAVQAMLANCRERVSFQVLHVLSSIEKREWVCVFGRAGQGTPQKTLCRSLADSGGVWNPVSTCQCLQDRKAVLSIDNAVLPNQDWVGV